MTYYGAKELAASFRTVRKNTIQIAQDIPENRYTFRATPDTRSIAELLAHIGASPMFQTHMHGSRIQDMKTVNFPELMQKVSAVENQPRTKTEMVSFLETDGERFAAFLEGLSESFLAEQVTMPPGMEPAIRSRFDMLLSAKEHEMHHRGQLTVLQRMIGLVPHLTRQMQERFAQRPQAQR